MKWRHWLLLGRLVRNECAHGPLPDLYDLESQGYVFSDGGLWYPTSSGIHAHREKLATPPSWELTTAGGPDHAR